MFEVIRETRKRSNFMIRELVRLDQAVSNVAAPCRDIGTRLNDRGRWNDQEPPPGPSRVEHGLVVDGARATADPARARLFRVSGFESAEESSGPFVLRINQVWVAPAHSSNPVSWSSI